MEREAGQLQAVARLVLTPPFRFCWRVTTEGLDNVPSTGPAILAPNHISVLDSFFVPLAVGRRLTYVGKAEYMDSWKTKFVFPAIGMIPIDRSGGDASKRALDAAASVLEAGELFGIYPEGTRARDGKLHKGHTGIARLALRTGTPIIPVGIIGSDLVQPPDARLPKPFRRVHIRFGRPIDVGRYAARSSDRMVLRQLTDEVMYEIRNLSGQEYVDSYAGKGDAPIVAVVPTGDGVAPVVALPERVEQRSERVVIASAAASRSTPVASLEADGVERRSSSAAIRSRPLDLGFELELSSA
ncbi:MAG: lysophospholipid acyltransferase family protein [Microthrixaceae bacterium]